MKQLIRKEFRENVRIALAALAVFSGWLALLCHDAVIRSSNTFVNVEYFTDRDLQPLLSSGMLMGAIFFCGTFATLLGWLQIRAERQPDLWAFLVHRPLTRSKIFLSKVIVGLGLYALATGLPIAVMIAVVRAPGYIAMPFAWAMTMPLMAIFLTGPLFYFAGLLTGLRRARWFATRAFGVGVAIFAAILVFALPEFWQALIVILIGGAILATTTWGSFQSGGWYRGQPIAGRITLVITLAAAGVLLIFLSLVLIINGVVDRLKPPQPFAYYQLTREGELCKVIQTGSAISSVEDLAGKTILDAQTNSPAAFAEFQQRAAVFSQVNISFDENIKTPYFLQHRYTDTRRFLSVLRVWKNTIWYLTGDGRLVGYDETNGNLVASVRPPEPFSGTQTNGGRFLRPFDYSPVSKNTQASPVTLLASPTAVYSFNLETRDLKPLFTVTNGDRVGGIEPLAFEPVARRQVIVVTRKSLRLLSPEGAVELEVPYLPPYPDYDSIRIALLSDTDSFVVWFNPAYGANKRAGGKLPEHIQWIDGSGMIGRSVDLPVLPGPNYNYLGERLLTLLLPPVAPVNFGEDSHTIWNSLRFGPAIVCVFIGWWICRRYNFSTSAKVGWGLLLLLGGIPGLLAFLSAREWPARERCASCNQLRSVEQEHCPHCQAVFPPPEKNGAEIFAGVGSQ